jgi:DNA polymerase III subunit beta
MTVTDTTMVQGSEVVVPSFVVPAHTLRNMLTAGLVAVGKDDTLPSLTGVRIEWDSTELRAVSTDRYRLMVADADMTCGVTVSGEGAVLLHRKDVAELIKVLPKASRFGDSNMVKVTVLGDSVLITADGWSRTLTVLQGDFPKYRSLIPREDSFAAIETIAVNPKFLGDIAKIPGERNMPARLRFTDARRPMVAFITGDNGVREYTYLLMPVRLT